MLLSYSSIEFLILLQVVAGVAYLKAQRRVSQVKNRAAQ